MQTRVPDADANRPLRATRVVASQRYVAIGYIDDAILFARCKEALQRVVNLVDKFNLLAHVKANAAKGFVLAFRVSDGSAGMDGDFTRGCHAACQPEGHQEVFGCVHGWLWP